MRKTKTIVCVSQLNKIKASGRSSICNRNEQTVKQYPLIFLKCFIHYKTAGALTSFLHHVWNVMVMQVVYAFQSIEKKVM